MLYFALFSRFFWGVSVWLVILCDIWAYSLHVFLDGFYSVFLGVVGVLICPILSIFFFCVLGCGLNCSGFLKSKIDNGYYWIIVGHMLCF